MAHRLNFSFLLLALTTRLVIQGIIITTYTFNTLHFSNFEVFVFIIKNYSVGNMIRQQNIVDLDRFTLNVNMDIC